MADGLRLVMDVPVLGRIAWIDRCPVQGRSDMLLVYTARKQLFGLRFAARDKSLHTEFLLELNDRPKFNAIPPNASGSPKCALSPDYSILAIHEVEGYLKIVSFNEQNSAEPSVYTVKLERFNLFALEFLHDSVNRLILAALYLDASSTRQIETYELVLNTSSNDYTLRPGPFRVTNLETSTDFISRVEPPYGGILAASHTGVRYINGRQPTLDVKLPSPMKIEAFNRVLHDKHVYLLADKTGRLFRVEILATSNAPGPGGFGQVQELKLKHLGQTSIASCLCYLDQRMVFVGSHYADSQLVRLPVQEGEGVEVLDRLCNLSPVVDFAVLQNNESSQGRIITCSGAYNNGTLRVLRNGMGITELASIDMENIQNIWRLNSHSNTLDDIEQVNPEGFCSQEPTLYCTNTTDGSWLQVTASSARIVWCRPFNEQIRICWTAPKGISITSADFEDEILALALTSGKLIVLKFTGSAFQIVNETELDHDIASLAIHRLDASQRTVCCVALWNMKVDVLDVATMQRVMEPFIFDVIPRSLALLQMGNGNDYLVIALGDGRVAYTQFSLERPSHILKTVQVAAQPVTLCRARLNHAWILFACADTVSVIYADTRIRFASSNLVARSIANLDLLPQSIVWATQSALCVGVIDDIQNLQVTTISLGEHARRLTAQAESGTVGVTTSKETIGLDGRAVDTHSFKVLDDQTLEILQSYDLPAFERTLSLESVIFNKSTSPHYVVGTVTEQTENNETRGRIMVFSATKTSLQLISALTVKNAVYCLKSIHGKLVAGVGNKVVLFRWSENPDQTWSLVPESSHSGHVLAITLQTFGDRILIGDLMKSLCLLRVTDEGLEEVARDRKGQWMMAVDVIGQDVYLGAEQRGGVFFCRADGTRLERQGWMNLGETVNRFREGFSQLAWVLDGADERQCVETAGKKSIFYATVGGTIGVMTPISREHYDILSHLERNLQRYVVCVGGLSHVEYRAFQDGNNEITCQGFIDGDLVEVFLDMDEECRRAVWGGDKDGEPMTTPMEDVVQLVDVLSRIH